PQHHVCKSCKSYRDQQLCKHDAEAKGFGDALMLDYRGYLAETTGANLFLVMNGEIHTPTPDCFLDGITRRATIALAEAREIPVIERHIRPEEVREAHEIFVTGTAAEVTPVRAIDELSYQLGPITQQLMEDFRDLTRPRQNAVAAQVG
ncbi:MAG: aminotransferase class IV, partial [Pseudomonadota bacterium]